MNTQTTAVMATQWGLLTRRQAIQCGMSTAQIDRLVRVGTWVVVRRGVYAKREFIEQLGTERHRRLIADRAVSLLARTPHALSHHSAAYLLDLPVLHARPARTHLTRPGIVGTHLRYDVQHHTAPFRDADRTEIAGLTCLAPARTALDIAREHGFRQGIVAADSAMRLGATRSSLVAVREQMRNWPHATVLDDVIASVSQDSDSPGETLARILVCSLGFGVPEPQFGITADGRTVWCDLRLGRHIVEFDGKVKVLPHLVGGLAAVSAADVVWEEKRRQDFIVGFGLGISRLTWDDMLERNWVRTAARLRREYLRTCELYGTDITDLAPYRARGERPRPTALPTTWPHAA